MSNKVSIHKMNYFDAKILFALPTCTTVQRHQAVVILLWSPGCLGCFRWPCILGILEIRPTVGSALKHNFEGRYQTIFSEEASFYSRITQPPEAGALTGRCCRAQEHKAVSTFTSNPSLCPQRRLAPGGCGKCLVSKTTVLLIRHQSSWPVYSPKVILHEHTCSTLGLCWQEKLLRAGVQQVVFFIKKLLFFLSNVPQGPKVSFIWAYFLWLVLKLLFNPHIEMQMLYTENGSVGGSSGKRNGPRWPVRHMTIASSDI